MIGYAEEIRWVFDTLAVRREEAALLAEIAAPRMNLLGPALVRELVSAIRGAEADPADKVLVFAGVDPDHFISHVAVTRIVEVSVANLCLRTLVLASAKTG